MNEKTGELIKNIVFRFVLPVLVPVVVGLGSAVISSKVLVEKLDARTTVLETHVLDKNLASRTAAIEVQIERHEKALDRDFARHEQNVLNLAQKTEDQEKRLTRLETLVGETQALLNEIRADVKILLRGGQQ